MMDGAPIRRPVGNIRITTSCPAFGQSGLSTMQLDFDVYDPENTFTEVYPEGNLFRVEELNNKFAPSRDFSLLSRTVSGGTVQITAGDILSQTNAPFDTSVLILGTVGGNEPYVTAAELTAALAAQCGFAAVSYTLRTELHFTAAMLTGISCREALELIAAPVCGVWVSARDGGIELKTWGHEGTATGLLVSSKYAKIDERGKHRVTYAAVTDTESGETAEYGSGAYGIALETETPFYDEARLAFEDAFDGYVFSSWNCGKALLNTAYVDHPAFSVVQFDTLRHAYSFSISVDCTGIYFSGGADPQNDQKWGYKTKAERELARRLKLGKTFGNVQINSAGIYCVNENRTKFGFDVHSSGVTEYDGAMADKKLPAITVNDDATEFSLDYNGEAYDYEIEWNGDNPTLRRKEART